MISGFNLIQNSINANAQPITQPNVQPSINGFHFIQNSINSQPEQQQHQQQQQVQRLLQSTPNSISRITTFYPIEEQYQEEEEYNEYQDTRCEMTTNYTSTNSSNPNNYITLTFANATYLTIITAKLTYQPISGMYNYLTVVDASNTYLQIIDASNTYLQIVDASNTYLQIIDASNTYLQIIDASNTYLQIVDASNNYLSRTGNPTSTATLTTFNGKISVEGATICADASNNTLGISTSITDASQIGTGTVVVGSLTNNNTATNAVIVGAQIYGSNNSVAIGNLCGSHQQATQTNNISIGRLAYSNASNCVTIGAGANNNANNCVAIGANALTDASANQSLAIGYNCQATLPNQIVLGTSTETVYCPGNPASGTTTPNTCLVLSSNVTLNNQTDSPTTGQLGYTMIARLATSAAISGAAPPTTYADISLNVGTWLITGVITVTSNTITTDSATFTISMNTTTTHNSKQLSVYQSFLSPNYLTTSFNYSNIIYNTTNSQLWYILISVVNNTTSINTSSTGAYINATRIA